MEVKEIGAVEEGGGRGARGEVRMQLTLIRVAFRNRSCFSIKNCVIELVGGLSYFSLN